MNKVSKKHVEAMQQRDASLERALRDAEDALVEEAERNERIEQLGAQR